MLDGMYAATFKGPTNHGNGVVVFHENMIYGGDHGFWYRGTLKNEGGNVSSDLHVERHSTAAQSVFGPLTKFDLRLSGAAKGSGFSVSGTVAETKGQTIRILARRIADL